MEKNIQTESDRVIAARNSLLTDFEQTRLRDAVEGKRFGEVYEIRMQMDILLGDYLTDSILDVIIRCRCDAETACAQLLEKVNEFLMKPCANRQIMRT